jgi:hypothetical protein
MIAAVVENLKAKFYDGNDYVNPFTAMYENGALYDYYYKVRAIVIGLENPAYIKAVQWHFRVKGAEIKIFVTAFEELAPLEVGIEYDATICELNRNPTVVNMLHEYHYAKAKSRCLPEPPRVMSPSSSEGSVVDEADLDAIMTPPTLRGVRDCG